MPWSRVLLGVIGLAVAALAARNPLRFWGATQEERRRPLPGDDLIPDERDVTTMATTIHAPPSAIWPWLVQMGYDRGGWYSWDRLDNGGRPSAEEINPAWQRIEQGDRVFSMPEQRTWFDVAHIEPERSLVLRSSVDLRGRPYDPEAGRPCAFVDARWEFFLDLQPDGSTRLLVRTGGVGAPSVMNTIVNWLFWHPAHVVMQHRQFTQLRRRAEGLAAQTSRPMVTAGRG